MTNLWKVNWAETKQHFIDWWNHEGLVLGINFKGETEVEKLVKAIEPYR